MNKLFFLVFYFVLFSTSFSMEEQHTHQKEKQRAAFVLQFSEKPGEEVRSYLKNLGFHWWNAPKTEWAGLSDSSEVERFSSKVKSQFHKITVRQHEDPPFLLQFSGAPEKKGTLRQIIKNLQFFWYNQHSHEWLGFSPYNDEQTIRSFLQPHTKISFKILDLREEKNWEQLTCSTRDSSEEEQAEDSDWDNENEIEFLRVKPYAPSFKEEPFQQILEKKSIQEETRQEGPSQFQAQGSKRSCLYSHLFTNENERALYEFFESIAYKEGMEFNCSVASWKEEFGISTLKINIDQWDKVVQAQIEPLLRKMEALEVVTKTPETVLPWIFQFENLRHLRIDLPEEEEEENQGENTRKVNLDLSNLIIAEFKNLKKIQFPKGMYTHNEGVKQLIFSICKKLKACKKLGNLTISENFLSIDQQAFQYYKAHIKNDNISSN